MKNSREKRQGRMPKIVWVVLMACFLGELFFYTWCRVQCIRTGYAIGDALREKQHLSLLKNNLKIEIAHLKSPERIAKIARTQLGLVLPSAEQVVVIP